MSVKVTTYESLDDRIAPEAITADLGKGLDIVDGHAVKAPGDYENPDRLYDMSSTSGSLLVEISSVYGCKHDKKSI